MRRGTKKPTSPVSPKRMPRERLAQALAPVAEDYLTFVQTHPEDEKPGDPKQFEARQNAGMAALQHLTELAAIVSGETAPEAVEAEVQKVLETTRTQMAKETEGGDAAG